MTIKTLSDFNAWDFSEERQQALKQKVEEVNTYLKENNIQCEVHGKLDYFKVEYGTYDCKSCIESANHKEKIRLEKIANSQDERYVRSLQYDCNVIPRYFNARFSEFKCINDNQTNILNQIKNWDKKQNIIFSGSTGTGKTFLASAFLNELIIDGILTDVYVTLAYRYYKFYSLPKLQINNSDRYWELLNCKLLIIDEYGIQDTDYKSQLLFEIIDYRYDRELPTMLISNLTLKEFKVKLSDATYSRLKDNCLAFNFTGEDYRLKDKKETKQDYSKGK